MTDSLYALPQTEEEPSQLLYTIPEETTPKLPAEVASQRAQKFSVALGDNSPDPDQMALDIEVGKEIPYRSMAAQEESLRLRQEKLKILDAISKERGEPATQADIEALMRRRERNLYWDEPSVSAEDRQVRNGYKSCVIWFTGLSAA